ncbi:BQ5605_C007g04429 [Microbotryum silenes-dioicae]|uniref:BQ5605_C007g04429 protein n=1 Tax=Microbotryum silenes-dioicae TaxID=796604 RepID=A0A2X0MU39_9BASI|nr:BQ5605_C007g04429 [Microbotryum silenes-dioicae]
MADPTRAAHLVEEDALASRSLTYSIEDVAQKRHELESDSGSAAPRYDSIVHSRGGKPHRAKRNDDDDDEDEEDDDRALEDEMAWQNEQRRLSRGAHERGPSPSTSTPTRATGSHFEGGAPRRAQPLSAAEASRRRVEWWRRAAVNAVFIAAWSVHAPPDHFDVEPTLTERSTTLPLRYSFSSAISVYNKWMFSKEHYNFPYPLFVTSFHMLVQWSLSAIALSMTARLRSKNRPGLKDFGTKIVPCGVASGLDIGLSNLSLRTITLSFYSTSPSPSLRPFSQLSLTRSQPRHTAMCKSSSLAFVLLFAFIFRLEKPSWRLAGIITIISGGVVLMVSTETRFDPAGMVEVLTASALGGLRWSLVQILLDKESLGMSNPIATLYWLAPIMGFVLATCSMIFDGWKNVFGNETFFGSFGLMIHTLFAMLLPGFLAFAMNVAEFGLIQRTSVVTLSVAGIFKEVAMIFLSMFIFHDQLTPINVSGLVVTLFGIALYNYFKYKQFTDDPSSAKGHGHGHGARSSPHLGDHDLSSVDLSRLNRAEDEDVMLLTERKRSASRALRVTNASAVYLDNLPHELTRGSHHTLESNASSASSSRSSLSIPTGDTVHLRRASHASKAHQIEEHVIPHLEERVNEGEVLLDLEQKARELERTLERGIPEREMEVLGVAHKGSVGEGDEGWDLLIEDQPGEAKR